MNPQIRFGEDLMSRVSYVMMNPGGERAAHRRGPDRRSTSWSASSSPTAGVDRDRVLEVVLVGNPIMHHLVLGIDPTPLGQAPFTLATDDAVVTAGRATSTSTCRTPRSTPVRASPVTSAPTRPRRCSPRARTAATAMQLLVDVGTNAEIVLGDRNRQFAASSPTGPAFEGAQISCGQRATAGAIERVRIDRESRSSRALKVIGVDVWSDDPGFGDGGRRRRASPACAARGSSTSSPRCTSPA